MAAQPADLLAVFETWVAQKPAALVHTFLEGDGGESDSYTMGQLNRATNGVAALIAAACIGVRKGFPDALPEGQPVYQARDSA